MGQSTIVSIKKTETRLSLLIESQIHVLIRSELRVKNVFTYILS